MPKQILQAKNFQNREDLDKFVTAELGSDESSNRAQGHQIIGTKEELKKLQLDDSCTVFGVRVSNSDLGNSTKKTIENKLIK